MKIVLAGGTGFVGSFLKQKYAALGHEVIIISRSIQHVNWHNKAALLQALEHADLLINLAGKSVDCRYTRNNKYEIYHSRIDSTVALGEALLACKHPPPVWINSSTATIYRHAADKPMTEATGEIGKGFSVGIATAWEKAFIKFARPGTRLVALRMAIVLGRDGGVVQPLKNLVRLGMGGKQGNGQQLFSWIHIEDVYRIIDFVQSNNNLSGPVNTCSPNPITNAQLMALFRKTLKMRWGIPTPVWLLNIGAFIIRTETELVLKSRWVLPEKLLAVGFYFAFDNAEAALNDILLLKN